MKAVMEHLQTLCYPSPCGRLLLGSYKGRLCLCDWAAERPRAIVDRRLQRALHAGYDAHPSELLRAAARQLDEYFNGQRTAFDLPLLLIGTDFQKTVWQRLLSIPYGETVSYAVLAQHRPSGSRPCRGCRKRGQRPVPLRALPPRGGQRRFAHGVCRRTGSERIPAASGKSKIVHAISNSLHFPPRGNPVTLQPEQTMLKSLFES